MPVLAQKKHPKYVALPGLLEGSAARDTVPLPTFAAPRLTLTRAVGQRVLPAAEGVGKPASPSLTRGENACYTLLVTQ